MKPSLFRLWMALMVFLSLLPQAYAGHSHHEFALVHEGINAFDIKTVSVAQLTPEGREVLGTIKKGGPFAYDRDGVVFSNFEHALPNRERGYYHEYTVRTPGVRNRGTRRIISGGKSEYYYTADHYKNFARIKE